MRAIGSFFFPSVPRGRVATMRTLVYAFVFVDVLLTTAWVPRHGYLPGPLYDPLFIGRILPLPVPTVAVVRAVEIGLLASAAIALSGRFVRVAGAAVFVLYLEWMVIAFSYGKVDHDRFAFLVALAVLPTVGMARWRDRKPDQAAGWAIRFIQVAVVATYFLAALAKLRFGGIEWVNGATLMRAVIRRGTFIGEPLEEVPWVLVAAQYWIMIFELASPLLFAPGWIGRAWWWVAVGFHVVTFSTIGIIFLPHVLCLLSFRRLERFDPRALLAAARARAPTRARTNAGAPP
ncbi:MAG: MFS transporter permease [Actinomycetota bacterium]